jgi:hypothetical protein
MKFESLDTGACTVPTSKPESDGALDPVGGTLRPDRSRPGMGLELKRADAERYRRA